MSYPPPYQAYPPPQAYPPTPQYSGCMKWAFYLLSVFIPLAGIILGVIYMSKPDPESKGLGKACLIIGIVVIVIGCCAGGIFGLLPIVMEALGSSGY